MAGETSEVQVHKSDSPDFRLVEPLFANASYTLDLDSSRNPRFYALADSIAKEIQSPISTKDVAQKISDHSPEQANIDTFRETAKAASAEISVPIDHFFDENDPAAQCLERTLLTQLVLAKLGVDSSLVDYQAQKDGQKLSHVVLEVTNKNGSVNIIDSNSATDESKTYVYTKTQPKQEYEASLKQRWGDITTNDAITPNVFSPKPNFSRTY